MPDKVYTPQEVAKMLSVTDRTITNYCKEGIIKAYKLKRSYRITQESLDNFLSQNK
jgi:excisionase family DNA binding protein